MWIVGFLFCVEQHGHVNRQVSLSIIAFTVGVSVGIIIYVFVSV